MITYIAQVINLFATTIQNVLLVASFIGKIIVATVAAMSSAIIKTIEYIILFFQIVYEDNISIFAEDLPNIANDMILTVTEQLSSLLNGFTLIYYDINFRFSATISTVKWFVHAIVTIVCEVLFLIKIAIILVGDTLWFILTFIPVHLPLILRAVLKNVTDIVVNGIVDTYMALLNITNFLTDVPLESFIGITSAIVIMRLCIHYKHILLSLAATYYWSIIRKLWYYYYALYNYFMDSEVREITRMSTGQELGSRQVDHTSATIDDGSAADALCVICQERQKCVLTLPCRHVCLCTECCMRLYGYQRTCPICRTFIYHSVTVYL